MNIVTRLLAAANANVRQSVVELLPLVDWSDGTQSFAVWGISKNRRGVDRGCREAC